MTVLRETLFVTAAAAAMLAAALLLAMGLRRVSAAVRARILSTALVAVLVLPAAMWLLPAPTGHREAELAVTTMLTIPATVAATPAAAVIGSGAPSAPGRADPTDRSAAVPLPAALWLLGAVIALVRLAELHRRARAWIRTAEPLRDPALLALAERLRREHGLRCSPPLLVAAGAPGPLTAGVLRPRIVLPPGAGTWSPAKAEAVLRHEVAHVARRDNLLQLCGGLVAALHWFDPLAWLAVSRLRRESELACDDAVLRGGVRPSSYARVLLDETRLGRSCRVPSVSPATPFACHARRRLRAMLDPRVDRRSPGRLLTALLGTFMLLIVLPLTSLRPPAAAGPVAAAGSTSGPRLLAMILPAGFKEGLYELRGELGEARAVNAWRTDETTGTLLPDGTVLTPDGLWTVETRDAVALPGSKYGCIFTSLDGYLRATRRDGDATYGVRAVEHGRPSELDLKLDAFFGQFGCGSDGRFRAYAPAARAGGRHLPFGEAERRILRGIADQLAARFRITPPDEEAETPR